MNIKAPTRLKSLIDEAQNWPSFELSNASSTKSLLSPPPILSEQQQHYYPSLPDLLVNMSSGASAVSEVTSRVGSTSSASSPSGASVWSDEHARVLLNVVVCPIVITIGTIGNIISFLTLIRPRLRHQTTAIYLAVLCLNDLGAIWFGLLRHYLLYGYGIEVRSSDVSCKIHILFTYWFMHNSSVLLAAVGLQRYLFVCQNSRFRAFMSHRSTVIVIVCLCVFVFVCELHYPVFYTMTLHPVKKLVGCTVDPNRYAGYYRLRENVIGYMQLIVFYALPFIILLISNALIIRNLITSTRRAKAQRATAGNKRRNISVMMIAISFYFILLTAPAQTYIGFAQFVEQRPTFLLEWTVITLVYYTNHASNFVLYFLTGNLFREEMYSMFKQAIVQCSNLTIRPCFPQTHTRILNKITNNNNNKQQRSKQQQTINKPKPPTTTTTTINELQSPKQQPIPYSQDQI